MTKTPVPIVRPARIEMEIIKDVEPQVQSDHTNSPPHPASVLALANAASRRGSGRRPATPSSHRRSQTIVVAGELEMEHIQKHKAVEDLHTELESKCKALEESQEEAQLAARIGQTLLQRNQEMGAEIESKAIELQNRAESAEQEVNVLERKLAHAVTQMRSLDIARTRATLEAEQLTQELEDATTQIQSLKGECARAKDQVQYLKNQNQQLEEKLESTQLVISKLERTQRHLHTELATKKERIDVLESAERYNIEHISRLEIENQSICQQQRILEQREMHLHLENSALMSRLSSAMHSVKDQQIKNQELVHAVQRLQGEVDDLRDALHSEQTHVHQLNQMHQELEAQIDRQRQNRELTNEEDELSTHKLRNGSLFHELSRQIREEMQDAKAQRAKQQAEASKGVISPDETVGLDSPTRSSTRTSRNPSSNNTDSVEEVMEEPSTVSHAEEAPKVVRLRPLPPLQLERRRSQQEEAAMVPVDSPQTGNTSTDDEDDDSLLKEFFVLTAAAVKIAGGGLCNDACNIHNEDLYAEAMTQNITFDQFHQWLEHRLEGSLDTSGAPAKRVSESKATRPQSSPAAPTTQSKSMINFWSR